ncbi:MAG: glycosyltransferase, partial [candidate division Zixibacteria bacterium]|nr:glycosyltransferase [candidate division Zixibacteria bacterium]
DRFLERHVLRRSWAIITATQTFADQVRQNNPDLDPARVHAVTNGVDPDDFEGLKFPDRKNHKFLILHLGSLYGNRDPRFFLKAVEQWVAQRPEVVSQTEIRFVGNTPGYAKTVAGTPLEAMVNFTGHAPHRQVLSMLWEANLLLLILGFDPAGAGVMPAKLYEYVATGRPILALIPDGIAADRIRKYHRGEPVTGEDISSVIQILNRQFDLWRESSKPEPSGLDLPEEFDRRLQNKKLAGILDRVSLSTALSV